MEKNNRSALAAILSIMVIFWFFETNRIAGIQQQQQQAVTTTTTETKSVEPSSQVALPKQNGQALVAENDRPTAEQYRESEKTVIRTDNVQIEISHLGGRVLKYTLLNHFTNAKDKEAIDMVGKDAEYFPLATHIGSFDDASVRYTLQTPNARRTDDGSYQLAENESVKFSFVGELPNNTTITKTVTVNNDSFFFDVDITLSNPTDDEIWLEWASYKPKQFDEAAAWSPYAGDQYNPMMATVFTKDNRTEKIGLHELQSAFRSFKANWIAFGGTYFINALITNAEGANIRVAYAGDYVFSRALGSKDNAHFTAYVGPKQEAELVKEPYQLEHCVDLGFFGPIGKPLLLLLNLFYELLGNYGLAIILLTLLVRALLLPLNIKSFKSMKAMQEIQPEIQALRERVTDPNELNQKMMALYKKKNINPLGGCFPMLLQMPIFFGMYNALRVSFELRGQPYALWIDDLSAPEACPIGGVNIPVMLIFMAAIMVIQTAITPSAGASKEQRRMMFIMSFVFAGMFFLWNFPSGLCLYMVVSSLIGIVQQSTIRSEKRITPLEATVVGSAVIFVAGYCLTLI